jgi:hypothetical protein
MASVPPGDDPGDATRLMRRIAEASTEMDITITPSLSLTSLTLSQFRFSVDDKSPCRTEVEWTVSGGRRRAILDLGRLKGGEGKEPYAVRLSNVSAAVSTPFVEIHGPSELLSLGSDGAVRDRRYVDVWMHGAATVKRANELASLWNAAIRGCQQRTVAAPASSGLPWLAERLGDSDMRIPEGERTEYTEFKRDDCIVEWTQYAVAYERPVYLRQRVDLREITGIDARRISGHAFGGIVTLEGPSYMQGLSQGTPDGDPQRSPLRVEMPTHTWEQAANLSTAFSQMRADCLFGHH